MPKREDIKRVMIIGSGPIIIGQAAEFDFSGSQACKAVREEGVEVVLVNSNPATFQTDIDIAERVYVEPLNIETVEAIIAKEKPDGILSGMGGQTALNLCSELAEKGILEKHGVALLGTQIDAIQTSEDREGFKAMMTKLGEPVAKSATAHSVEEAKRIVKEQIGYPVIIRAGYTLGGTGGGVAHDAQELEDIVGRGLIYSRIRQVLIEESVLGWKEFEYEVMRDSDDNCLTVCNMENFDAMGVHTGESIVVAPAQTLTDREHQTLRSAAIKIIRALDIEGGCNIQFAVNPESFEYRVVEVNPRVSRSSALASKATGYPIARVAAKIALGMRLHEIPNDVTGKTPASFEPAIDYVITKIPRWPFDKFRMADKRIGFQMKSTGEVMAIGKTIEESLQKAVRSLEIDADGLRTGKKWTDEQIRKLLIEPTHQRLFVIAEALRRHWAPEEVAKLSGYDLFFIQKIANVVGFEERLASTDGDDRAEILPEAKALGFADSMLADVWGVDEEEVRAMRTRLRLRSEFKMVDTCSAEFAAQTPYYYSTYSPLAGAGDESKPTKKTKAVILGSGPIRIGQGIEFDYCCVHATLSLREHGIETIMINNNPETVSTDYDTADKLYFEPLTFENVMDIIEREKPDGVLVQFGGQTAINLATPLKKALERRPELKTTVWGTQPEAIERCENREVFNDLCKRLGIPKPDAGYAHSEQDALREAGRIGYPVLVRPSYVLGGRAMQVVANADELKDYIQEAVKVTGKDKPILIDRFLSNAVEVDVDAVADGDDVYIGGIMEHIEEAGVHSGDSSCVVPPTSLPLEVQETIREYTRKIALELGVVGLINIQYAVKDGTVYVLEANPRSSRTVPFVSKAVGVPMAKIAARAAMGHKIADMDLPDDPPKWFSVKTPVFPFLKLAGVDSVLGPEMKSTGEVMGIAEDYGAAFAKAMEAAGNTLPRTGNVFVSVRNEDKKRVTPIVADLAHLGYHILATRGTAHHLRENDIEAEVVWKVGEKGSPDAIDLLRKGTIQLIINTAGDEMEAPERRDGYMMRRVATELQIPFIATVEGARAAVGAIERKRRGTLDVKSLHDHHGVQAKPLMLAKQPRKVES